jgi:hypothetical protein
MKNVNLNTVNQPQPQDQDRITNQANYVFMLH